MFRFSVFLYLSALAFAQTPEELIEAGHVKRARSRIHAQLKSNPNDAHALYLMGRVKHLFGDNEGALPFLEKAVALEQNSADHHSWLGQILGRVAQRSSVFRQFGLARRCKRELEAALAIDPEHFRTQVTYMMYLAKAPGVIGGDKQKARAIYNDLPKIHGARGYMGQAQYAEDQGEKDAPVEFWRKAVETDAKYYPARISLANKLLADKRYEEAEKYIREALSIDSGRVQAHVLLAAMYAMEGKWNDMEKVHARAEELVPDDLSPLYNSGRILLSQGKELAAAERYFKRYLTQEPEAQAPPAFAAHWSLGLVYEKLGRKTEAIAELSKAVKLNPEFEQAKKDLSRLKRS